MVEYLLPKQNDEGSIPFSCSIVFTPLVATLVATDSTFINKVAFRGIVVSASLPNIYNSNNCWVRSPIGIGGLL